MDEQPEHEEIKGGLVPVSDRGIMPSSIDELWRFAQFVSASGLAPKGMQAPAQIFVAVQHGLEIGLRPMQAVQSIAVINGRPSLWGDSMLGLVKESSKCADFKEWTEGEGENMVAHCFAKRVDQPTPIERTFDVARAKKAGLWGKQGPWQQYPERMLQLRARALCLRDGFPDVLKGIGSAEEMRDVPPANAASVEVVGSAVTPKSATASLVDSLRESPQPIPTPEDVPAQENPSPVSAPPDVTVVPDKPKGGRRTKTKPSEGQDESSADPLAGLQAADCVNGENLYFCPHGGVCQGLGLMNRQGLIVHLDKMHKGKLS